VLSALFILWFSARQPSFEKTVRPILEQHCQPCHFEGGKMYARLPFDRPETIVKLGTRLFTRIKDEKEREVIRKFLNRGRGVAGSRGDGGKPRTENNPRNRGTQEPRNLHGLYFSGGDTTTMSLKFPRAECAR
jgi:hypothetical protein